MWLSGLGLFYPRCCFEEHFRLLVPRVKKVAGTLHRLLPNLRGPREEVRRLLIYCGVVRSMALYGARFWSKTLSSVKRCRAMFNSFQWTIATRFAWGYRAISFEAAILIVRFPYQISFKSVLPFQREALTNVHTHSHSNFRIHNISTMQNAPRLKHTQTCNPGILVKSH